MTDDVWVKMPPLPFEYRGTDAAREFFMAIHANRRNPIAKMVPTRANGQPAWGTYILEPGTATLRLTGLITITIVGDRICETTRFETAVTPYFGLPRNLDA